MAIWHFMPFGLTIAVCVFVSWQATENQNALRAESSSATDDDSDERRTRNGALLCDYQPPHPRGGPRPPRTASELRARLSTLSKMPPGPRRLARGRALSLAAENALREASPNDDENENDDDEKEWQRVESRAATAIRETLPWLDARLAALAAEDEAAIKCGLCEICAGHDDACATHAWPCGEVRGCGRGGGNEAANSGNLFASLFPFASTASSSSLAPSKEAFSSSKHRACARCSSRCGSKCPWCRREGKAALSLSPCG